MSCCEDFSTSFSTVKGWESVPVKFLKKDSCCMMFVFLILVLGLVS